MQTRLVVYVDVDDTLVRSFGTKTMPVPRMVEHVKALADSGAQIYCWSTVGATYARETMQKLGIEQCFVGFLPKPNVIIDDQALNAWRQFTVLHPLDVSGKSVEEYWSLVKGD